MLTAVATAIRAGLAVPRPLTAVIAEANAVHDSAPLPADELGNPRGRFDDAVIVRHRRDHRPAVGSDQRR